MLTHEMTRAGVERFFAYCRERQGILLRRQSGMPAPWTDDPILGAYRFCNVFREDDKVTAWMRENLTKPIGDDFERQMRAAVVFRWFNKIETGELLAPLLLGHWDLEEARRLLKDRVAQKQTILGAAYMIKSPLRMNKVDGLLQCIAEVDKDIPHLAAHIDPGETELEGLHSVLCDYSFLGPFMAYQMVCDLRFSPVMSQAPDIYTWTCAGPGSARGMSRLVYDRPDQLSYTSSVQRPFLVGWMRDLLSLSQSMPDYWPAEWPTWELSTVQHNLCEYDKYERARLGEGSPKQRYTPA